MSRKKKKSGKTPASKPSNFVIDPTLVVLPAGHFKDEDGDDLPQLTFAEVSAEARGIAVCSPSEALPFLGEADSLSTSALGLLLTQDISADHPATNMTPLVFPGIYSGTGEPILINGALLSLGDMAVNRHSPQDVAKNIEVADTKVLKLQVFRDELVIQPWDTFAESPIRVVIQHLPALQLCRKEGCGPTCPCFHPPVDVELSQVVHEIWSRRFMTLAGKTVAVDRAELFQAYLRITDSALPGVLAALVQGIYFEPRSEERGPDTSFSVIWLPGADRTMALHKMRTCTHSVALARMGTRFGVRVELTNEQAAHEHLRPDVTFLKVDVQKVFRLHPLPFGLQRKAIEELLKQWKWTARPLQPGKGSHQGGSWDIGTQHDPPALILCAFGKDVLVTQLKERTIKDQVPKLTASKKTQQHMAQHAKTSASSSSSSTSGDPWWNSGNYAQHDPWKNSMAPPGLTQQPIPAAQPGHRRIDEVAATMKAEVHTELQAAIQKELADKTAGVKPADFFAYQKQQEQRLGSLESNMQELKAQGTQFKTWFDQVGKQLQVQDQTMQGFRGELTQMQNDAKCSNANLERSVQALQSTFSSELDAKLSTQFERFENLLAKKNRTE